MMVSKSAAIYADGMFEVVKLLARLTDEYASSRSPIMLPEK